MSESNATLETFVLSELLPSDRYAYRDEELLIRCKESTMAYLSRGGTIFTRDLSAPFVDDLLDFYIEETGKIPYIKLVTAELIEQVLQLPDDMLLSDITESLGGSTEHSEEQSLVAIDFNELLNVAYQERVADVHISIMSNGTLVRGRSSSGLVRLHKVMRNRDYGVSLGNQVFQVLASEGSSGSFYESVPDENRFSWEVGGKLRNYRASTMPIKGGAKINLRCLDPYSDTVLTPHELGFLPQQIKQLMKLMNMPYGGLLISGQTGSGKTTTLMSFLDVLPNNINVHTLEDPVEWLNSKFSQTEIDMDGTKDEYDIYRGSFADFGKRLLRQDIDVAMFGEIRDELSASIFYRLASTGHMAVGTVHTGSALGCITMLIKFFKLSPEQVADSDSFNGFLNQKLANKLCPHCSNKLKEHKEVILQQTKLAIERNKKDVLWRFENMTEQLALVESFCGSESDLNKLRFKNDQGCVECSYTGLKGKTVIAEILVMDNSIRRLVQDGNLLGIQDYLKSVNYMTTRDHAIQKIGAGLIDIHEACRLINDMDASTKQSFGYDDIANEMRTLGGNINA